MTIQIDDAGWGSLVGGCLIGCYRVETGEFTAHEIAVENFQGELMASRRYLPIAWEAAKRGLDVLRHENNALREPIEVCQGWVNQDIRRKLGVPGSKITGPFQARIEAVLLEYLRGLGFDYRGSTEEYGKLFFESVRWLKGGNPNRRGMDPERMKLAKTGWKTFPAYRDYPWKEAVQRAKAIKARARWNRWGNSREEEY